MAGIEKQRVRVDVGGFIRNQEQRSIGDLPARALAAERYRQRAIGPPPAGVAAHWTVDEARRNYVAANAFFFAGAGDRPAERDLRRLGGFVGRIAAIAALA